MTTIEQVIKVLEKVIIQEPVECSIEDYDNYITLSMRDGVDDEPTARVRRSARAIKETMSNIFGKDITMETEYIDEWIDVTFTINN